MMVGTASVRRIHTVEEALELFFAVADGMEPDFDQLEFGEEFNVEFRLPTYHSEMPRQFIQSYHTTYRRLYQLIALIENGRADMKTLTKDQQEKYAFSVHVDEGSSRLEDNGAHLLGKAVKEAFKRMSGRQAVITILGSVLLVCTTWGAITYISAQRDARIAEVQSKERVELITSVSDAHSRDVGTMLSIVEIMKDAGDTGPNAVAAVEDIQDQRLRAMAETDKTIIGDMEITGEQARELRSSSRRKSFEITAEIDMRVVDVNTADSSEVMVVLEDVETGEQSRLRYRERLMGTKLNSTVFDALASRRPARFKLRGKMVDDEISYQEILAVEPIGYGPEEG